MPEVTLGLLPGGGGVVRTVRMLGIADRAAEGAAAGPAAQARRRAGGRAGRRARRHAARSCSPAAKAWIAANLEAQQPWDVKGYKIPGGTPSTPAFAANLPAFPANLRKQLKGAPMPAPPHILAAAVEGAQVDFDTALTIEARYFVDWPPARSRRT